MPTRPRLILATRNAHKTEEIRLILGNRFEVLDAGMEGCWTYGRIYRHLSDNGLLIGANDLWIAATALAHGLPLVTRNDRHFRRVAGLHVIGY